MNNKKNVLIIIQHLCRGGAEKSAAVLSTALTEMGHEVTIVTFFSEQDYPTTYPYSGEYICLGNPANRNKYHTIKDFFTRIWHLHNIKKDKKITTSISFLFAADVANILSARGETKIISIRSSLANANLSTMMRRFISFLYPRADTIVVQNTRVEEDMKAVFGIKNTNYSRIPNFYAIDALKAAADIPLDTDEKDIEKTEYEILYQIGRLYKPKGQWHLLRIFAEIVQKKPQTRLIIAGEGDLHDYLVEYAQSLNLSIQSRKNGGAVDLSNHHVVLLGYTQNPHKYLRFARVFVFTSIFEGFPNALAEAMICGHCAVFSTDCKTGPKELIAPNTPPKIAEYPYIGAYGVLLPTLEGEFIDANTVLSAAEQMWTDTILQTIDDQKRLNAMADAASVRMHEFSYPNIINQWDSLIK